MAIGETIGLIEALGGSGGPSLPSVTSADNGKVLGVADGAWAAGVQEYWIPVEYSGGALSIPEGKETEVGNALARPDRYWVRGIKISNEFYAGYVEKTFGFIVPLGKTFMMDMGYDCAGKIRITQNSDGFAVTIEPDRFIVALTPTEEDFSGTMDKTVAEITAAYEAGQEIVYRFWLSASSYIDVPVTAVYTNQNDTYPSFNAYNVNDGMNILLFVATGATNDGTQQTYSTVIYSLTPAS